MTTDIKAFTSSLNMWRKVSVWRHEHGSLGGTDYSQNRYAYIGIFLERFHCSKSWILLSIQIGINLYTLIKLRQTVYCAYTGKRMSYAVNAKLICVCVLCWFPNVGRHAKLRCRRTFLSLAYILANHARLLLLRPVN